jgi:hypothetical protein
MPPVLCDWVLVPGLLIQRRRTLPGNPARHLEEERGLDFRAVCGSNSGIENAIRCRSIQGNRQTDMDDLTEYPRLVQSRNWTNLVGTIGA